MEEDMRISATRPTVAKEWLVSRVTARAMVRDMTSSSSMVMVQAPDMLLGSNPASTVLDLDTSNISRGIMTGQEVQQE
jgi:hypothetical protein